MSDALKLMHAQADASGATPTGLFLKELAHAHRLRADVYKALFVTVGDARLYVDLCLADCGLALQYDSREDRAGQLRTWANYQIGADDTAAAKAQPPAVRPDARAAPDLATSFLKVVFGTRESSAQSEAVATLLETGGELLAAGWQQTDRISGELMDQFVNPYVAAGARGEAANEAKLAREILKRALERGELRDEDRRNARDHLKAAVEKNPRSAQFLFELAVVEQNLGELDSARTHLLKATDIAKSNLLFFHQLALVCEQLELPAEALLHERRTVELAPGNPDFIAQHAKFALAAARVAKADGRAPLLSEAKMAIAEFEELAHDDQALATLKGLKSDLAALDGKESPSGG